RTPVRRSNATCAAALRPAPRRVRPRRSRTRRRRRPTGSASSRASGRPACSWGRGDGRTSRRPSDGRGESMMALAVRAAGRRTVEYDDCVIATGSSAVKAPVDGADGRGVHSFWTLDEARAVLAEIGPGSHVVMVGAGFIAFTILNSILALGATLTIVEVVPRILPRMIDAAGAKLVEDWLTKHGV